MARAWAERLRRLAAPTAPSAADLAALEARLGARLQQMEAHVDALAVEVERVGEGQRFLARALAEQPSAVPPRTAAPPARIVTPH